jgi:hypothetical protein
MPLLIKITRSFQYTIQQRSAPSLPLPPVPREPPRATQRHHQRERERRGRGAVRRRRGAGAVPAGGESLRGLAYLHTHKITSWRPGHHILALLAVEAVGLRLRQALILGGGMKEGSGAWIPFISVVARVAVHLVKTQNYIHSPFIIQLNFTPAANDAGSTAARNWRRGAHANCGDERPKEGRAPAMVVVWCKTL